MKKPQTGDCLRSENKPKHARGLTPERFLFAQAKRSVQIIGKYGFDKATNAQTVI